MRETNAMLIVRGYSVGWKRLLVPSKIWRRRRGLFSRATI